MILYIDTTKDKTIEISLKKDGKEILKKEIKSDFDQAKKLLPAISKALKDNKSELMEIERIEVVNKGGSFTSLRIGVVTANALGYALGVPVKAPDGGEKEESGFSIVEPYYDREPNIGKKV